MTIDELPAHFELDETPVPYFLAMNRDVDGRWCGAYIRFDTYEALCAVNSADNLSELAIRLEASLIRHNILTK